MKLIKQNNFGRTVMEVLYSTAIFLAVFGVTAIASKAIISASKSGNTGIQQLSTARVGMTMLSDEIVKSGIYGITVKDCGSECIGKKISFKIPIVDNLPDEPIVNSMYKPDGRVKFGAYYKDANGNTVGAQYCRYAFMRTAGADGTNGQLVKKVICEPDAQCGRNGCQVDIGETRENCPIDCGGCGDGVCDANETAVSGGTQGQTYCNDCVSCGDGICSPGEECGGSRWCAADCNVNKACVLGGNTINN